MMAVSLLFATVLIGLLTMTTGAFVWMATSWAAGGMMGGGGRNSSGDAARQGSAAEAITIQDFAYSPGNLQLPVGVTVTWTNRDTAPHSATDSGRTWDTGVLSRGKSKTLTFEAAGTFDYFCSVHPSMKARLVVQ